ILLTYKSTPDHVIKNLNQLIKTLGLGSFASAIITSIVYVSTHWPHERKIYEHNPPLYQNFGGHISSLPFGFPISTIKEVVIVDTSEQTKKIGNILSGIIIGVQILGSILSYRMFHQQTLHTHLTLKNALLSGNQELITYVVHNKKDFKLS